MKILSFDIESCTGNPRDGSLCSFGYCLAEDFEIIERGDILVNPKPDKFKLGRNGEEPRIKLAYPEKVFRAAPRFPEQYDKIKRLFAGDILCIGFAVGNDVRYLNNACEVYDLPVIEYKFIDVQMLLGFFDPADEGAGLGKLGEKYGICFEEHKSEEDAVVTLKLLGIICERSGRSLAEILDYYEIIYGCNKKSGVVGMFSLAQLYNRKGLKRSKAQGGILLHEFLEEMNARPRISGSFNGRRVCFNATLEKEDINYSRALIKKIYDLGGRYTGDLTVANTYVAAPEEKEDARLGKVRSEIASGRKIRILNQDCFIESLGDVEPANIDDVSVLIRHSREKQLRRREKKRKR